jgi:hypothetical protein
MKKPAFVAAIALAAASAAFAQNPQSAPEAEAAIPAGLSDLEKTTFACPRAALNAAAREVANYPSQGTYQFSYFNIVSASHHAAYEVHFTSNYTTEPVLKFCVAIYCQQGFDPATTKASVSLIGAKTEKTTKPTKPATHAAGAGHAVDACSPPRPPAKRRSSKSR